MHTYTHIETCITHFLAHTLSIADIGYSMADIGQCIADIGYSLIMPYWSFT